MGRQHFFLYDRKPRHVALAFRGDTAGMSVLINLHNLHLLKQQPQLSISVVMLCSRGTYNPLKHEDQAWLSQYGVQFLTCYDAFQISSLRRGGISISMIQTAREVPYFPTPSRSTTGVISQGSSIHPLSNHYNTPQNTKSHSPLQPKQRKRKRYEEDYSDECEVPMVKRLRSEGTSPSQGQTFPTALERQDTVPSGKSNSSHLVGVDRI